MAISTNGTTSILSYGSPVIVRNLPKMSISAWIRPFGLGGGSLGRIVSKETGYVFYLGGTAGIQFGVYRTGGTYNVLTGSVLTINANAPWQHVACVWNGEYLSTSVKMFVNGIERSYSVTSSGSGTQVDDTSNNLAIGNRSSDSARGFNGQIAEVGIWDNLLTNDEIISLSERFSCRYISPDNLQFHCPLIRSLSPVNDTANPTPTNISIVDHPSIIL